MAISPSGRPSWQRNSVFRFFASVKLAVVLLAVLILGAIAGTIYESSFDAKVARAYVYGSPWFNIWLLFLAANLAVSALSRWPWKKHHVAFLITHLGIITLLTGSLIGRTWGTEGTITLFKGDPPTNRLLIDQHQLRVRDTDGIIKGYSAEFINHPPTAQKPWDLGALASGARLSLVDYSAAIESKLNPRPLKEGGAAALHFTIATAMMNQRLDSWLLTDNPQHGSFSMGLADIQLKRGSAPHALETPAEKAAADPLPAGEVEIEESIFAFAKAPDQQIAKSTKGGSTGAKVTLSRPEKGNKGDVVLQLADKSWTFEVAQNLGKHLPLDGSAFALHIDNYWADFRIENGQPGTLSERPDNPAVMVTLRGKGIPAPAAADPHESENAAPSMPSAAGDASLNHIALFISDEGVISYDLASRKGGHSTGILEFNKPLSTGWADWQLTVDQLLPHTEQWMDFKPVVAAGRAENLPEGVRIRIQQGNDTFEQWVPAGWQIAVPTKPAEVQVAYGWKQIPLPIGLELTEFEVQRNEGTDTPAGFKSTLRITTPEGETARGQCWMNNPFSYPGASWRTWTGLTYKMSQASWNPENLGQSTIQILRDPGWLLKWIGSLLVVTGIFMLFYLRGFRRPGRSAPSTRLQARESERNTDVATGAVAEINRDRRGEMRAWLLCGVVLLTGCASGSYTPWTEQAVQSHKWGYYSGPIDTRWESDGRTMVLLSEMRYSDPKGQVWVAPAGAKVDGASIPRAFWSFMGGPFEGRYRAASVLHDVAYDDKSRPWQECDRMFYNAMRCSGVSAAEAKTMYYALYRFGRHWKFAARKAEPVAVLSSEIDEGNARRATAVDPEEVSAIQQWIRENDPSLSQIESRAEAVPPH